MLAGKQEDGRRSKIDGRMTRHPGYGISLSCPSLIERASNPADHRLYFNQWL